MEMKKYQLYILLFLLNCIILVNTLRPNCRNEKEMPGMDSDIICSENESVDGQVKDRMASLIQSNMNLFEKKIQEKVDGFDKMMEEKIKLISVYNSKCSYHRVPSSCYDLKGCHNDTGIYNIMIPKASNKALPNACDFKTLGGGWTIIQRRDDGSENFYRKWTDYVDGFGDVNGEFFIGLKQLHALTSFGDPQELYIMLENFDGERKYARYGTFKVDSEIMDYNLTVGEYSGDAGDSLAYHNGMKFSTRDRDNDDFDKVNCADGWKGPWWYSKCFDSNLNGLYFRGEKIKTKGGINWKTFGGAESSLKFTQMMIRTKED